MRKAQELTSLNAGLVKEKSFEKITAVYLIVLIFVLTISESLNVDRKNWMNNDNFKKLVK